MPVYGGELTLPDISLHELIWEKLQEYGNATAMIDASRKGKSASYTEMYDWSKICAAYIQSLGVNKGDVVSICSSRSIEFGYLMIGIAACGAAVSPHNPSCSKSEIVGLFTILRPRFVFVDEEVAEMLKTVKKETSSIERIFVIGESNEFTTLCQIFESTNSETFQKVEINPTNDIVFIPHSSGTTGFPKCVKMTHQSYVAYALIGKSEDTDRRAQRSFYSCLPISHMSGFIFLIKNIVSGIQHITEREFHLPKMFEDIERYRATTAACTPPMLIEIVNSTSYGNYDLSSLKHVITGGAIIPHDVIHRAMHKLKVDVETSYGMTETGAIASGWIYENTAPQYSGKVQKTVEMKIVDISTEEECAIGCDGEIRLKGPQITKGYMNNPSANATSFDQDGWFRTGDIGHVDEDGNVYVLDRMKEIIKYRTLQVSPAELESVIIRHHSVSDVGVVGIPDEICGEVPKAFVVRCDPTLTAEDVHNIVNEHLIDYKRLRGGVEFVTSIPVSRTGKIQRNVLKKMAGF